MASRHLSLLEPSLAHRVGVVPPHEQFMRSRDMLSISLAKLFRAALFTRSAECVCVALSKSSAGRWKAVLLLLLGLSAARLCGGEEAPAPPADGYLILQNGVVVQGRISGTRDGYVAAQPSGKLFVPLEQVRFQCGS